MVGRNPKNPVIPAVAAVASARAPVRHFKAVWPDVPDRDGVRRPGCASRDFRAMPGVTSRSGFSPACASIRP